MEVGGQDEKNLVQAVKLWVHMCVYAFSCVQTMCTYGRGSFRLLHFHTLNSNLYTLIEQSP